MTSKPDTGCRRMGAADRPPGGGGRPRRSTQHGRRPQVVSPIQGFGRMWQKTYRVPLDGANVTPAEVIEVWKTDFPEFWPKGSQFFAPLTGIAPGEVARSRRPRRRLKLSTGVLVLYADDESFTLMTPQGHMFAGWITFSAFDEDGATDRPVPGADAGAGPAVRARDRRSAATARRTALVAHAARARRPASASRREPVTSVVCVDRGGSGAKAANVWHRTPGYARASTPTTAPLRKLGRSRQCMPDVDAVVVGSGPERARGRDRAGAGGPLGARPRSGRHGRRRRAIGRADAARLPCTTSARRSTRSRSASPFLRTLPLAEHGLEWIEPPAALAHPLDDGTRRAARALARSGRAGPRRATTTR